MLKLYIKAKDAIRTLHTRESGQDAFEYLLVIGGVSVVVVAAIAAVGVGDPFGLIAKVGDAIDSIGMPV